MTTTQRPQLTPTNQEIGERLNRATAAQEPFIAPYRAQATTALNLYVDYLRREGWELPPQLEYITPRLRDRVAAALRSADEGQIAHQSQAACVASLLGRLPAPLGHLPGIAASVASADHARRDHNFNARWERVGDIINNSPAPEVPKLPPIPLPPATHRLPQWKMPW